MNDVGRLSLHLEQQLAAKDAEIDQLKQLCDRIKDLEDQFANGIQYDEVENHYILVWTKREIDQAKERAAELITFFNELEKADD